MSSRKTQIPRYTIKLDQGCHLNLYREIPGSLSSHTQSSDIVGFSPPKKEKEKERVLCFADIGWVAFWVDIVRRDHGRARKRDSRYIHIHMLTYTFTWAQIRTLSAQIEDANWCTHIIICICTPVQIHIWVQWLQHTATCCNIRQHTATHCNTLQHTATYRKCWRWGGQLMGYDDCNTKQHTATHCHALQHTSTHCNTLQCTTQLTAGGVDGAWMPPPPPAWHIWMSNATHMHEWHTATHMNESCNTHAWVKYCDTYELWNICTRVIPRHMWMGHTTHIPEKHTRRRTIETYTQTRWHTNTNTHTHTYTHNIHTHNIHTHTHTHTHTPRYLLWCQGGLNLTIDD